MPEFEKNEFKFPDEVEEKVDITVDEDGNNLEIEIEDDTPEEDRGRKPADPEAVKKLEVEVDELDKYSKDAKDKIIKMKRVWNDERRAKEAAERERLAAIDAAQRLLEENKRIKQMLQSGEEEYKEAKKDAAKAALKQAKQQYKEAYESGDVEKITEAQEEMVKAQMQLDKVKKFKLPPLQEEKFEVQPQQQYYAPQPDSRVMEWQSENPWFGQDEEMTAAALGLHEKMAKNGVKIGSDEYYETLDKTIRKRFPENFESDHDDEAEEVVEEPKAKPKADKPKAKPATVVAPATRSTAPKKVRLSQSQVAIAKRLGLTPEQYVRELLKMEA